MKRLSDLSSLWWRARRLYGCLRPAVGRSLAISTAWWTASRNAQVAAGGRASARFPGRPAEQDRRRHQIYRRDFPVSGVVVEGVRHAAEVGVKQRTARARPSQGDLLFIGGIIVAMVLCVIVFSTGSFVGGTRCPSQAFLSVKTGGDVPFIIGLFAGPLGIVLAAIGLRQVVRRRALSLAGGALCLATACACFYDLRYSYACIDSDRIVSHDAYGTDTTDGWTDLRVVSSDCFHYGRGQSSAELRLLFGSGRTLVLTIANPAVRAKSDELRSAMARTGYRYRPNGSINDQTCPPGLYRVLTDWPRTP